MDKFKKKTKYFITEEERNCFARFSSSYCRYKMLYERAVIENLPHELQKLYFDNYIENYISYTVLMEDLKKKYNLPNICNHLFKLEFGDNFIYIRED